MPYVTHFRKLDEEQVHQMIVVRYEFSRLHPPGPLWIFRPGMQDEPIACRQRGDCLGRLEQVDATAVDRSLGVRPHLAQVNHGQNQHTGEPCDEASPSNVTGLGCCPSVQLALAYTSGDDGDSANSKE